SSRRRHTRFSRDWSSDVCSSDLYCRVEHLFDVPPTAFVPQPKVWSAIVRLTPHTQLPCPARSPAIFQEVVRVAFTQRRKTLKNRSEERRVGKEWRSRRPSVRDDG